MKFGQSFFVTHLKYFFRNLTPKEGTYVRIKSSASIDMKFSKKNHRDFHHRDIGYF